MDQKKIGSFLQKLRKEKELTQGQLADRFNVSDRTISRWETGVNMPDLSILIEISEFYEVEIEEILDGERKSETMNDELKGTLLKVADYNEMKNLQVAKAGNIAFGAVFATAVIAIVVQILITKNIMITIGETVILLVGGGAYLFLIVKNGVWDSACNVKDNRITSFVISLVCGLAFSALLYVILRAQADHAAIISGTFFAGITVIGYAVIRALSTLSKKNKK